MSTPPAQTTSTPDMAQQRAIKTPMKAAMKAVVRDRYGPAEVLQLEELEVPKIAARDVLLRVGAAGLGRGAWHLMTGRPYVLRLAGYGLLKPKEIKLGTDVAGVVEAVGEKVTAFRPGDRVFGISSGAFAEYAVARADKLALIPEGVSLAEAAAVPDSGLTALQALRDHGRVQRGQRVLIIGASGGVGTFAVQLAKVFGAVVTGVCSTAKLGLVRETGADAVLDYTHIDLTDTGERFDLVLDIGGHRPLSQLRRLLVDEGTLVIVGSEGGDALTGGLGRQLRGMVESRFSRQRISSFIARENGRDLETLAGLLEAGKGVSRHMRIKPGQEDRLCA